MFSFALAWACIGTVDIVAVAPGKIIPSGCTKTIQPFETGVVRAIHVRDGQTVQTVNSGDVLIELDPTVSGAELGHSKSDLMAAQLEAARLRAALAGKGDPRSPSSSRRTTAEQNAKIAAIGRQVAVAPRRRESSVEETEYSSRSRHLASICPSP